MSIFHTHTVYDLCMTLLCTFHTKDMGPILGIS